MKTIGVYILIVFLSTSVFVLSNTFFEGYLHSPQALGKEIKTSPDSLYQYKLVTEPPFQYRPLFYSLVKSFHQQFFNPVSSQDFFIVYRFLSWFFLILASLSFFYLLSVVGFSNGLSLAGLCVFLLLPPILLAYTVPVHTREDTLGYFVFFVALAFLIRRNTWAFLFTASVGVLCRETLLLLPLLYFFFADENNRITRLVVTITPFVVWLALRYLLGVNQYDYWEGFRWNLHNPLQVVAFAFITFNLGWLPFISHYIGLKSKYSVENYGQNFFCRSALFVLSMLLLTTFLGGLFNEIRLLYLFSPWVIIFLLNFLTNYRGQLKEIIVKPLFIVSIVIALLLMYALIHVGLTYQQLIIDSGKYQVPYHVWIVSFILYTFVSILFAIPVLIIFRTKLQQK